MRPWLGPAPQTRRHGVATESGRPDVSTVPEATIGPTPPAGKGPTRFDGPGKPQKPRSDSKRAQKCDGFISAFGLTSVAGQDCRAKSFNLCDLIGRFPITEE